jgi:hypothetical protein
VAIITYPGPGRYPSPGTYPGGSADTATTPPDRTVLVLPTDRTFTVAAETRTIRTQE